MGRHQCTLDTCPPKPGDEDERCLRGRAVAVHPAPRGAQGERTVRRREAPACTETPRPTPAGPAVSAGRASFNFRPRSGTATPAAAKQPDRGGAREHPHRPVEATSADAPPSPLPSLTVPRGAHPAASGPSTSEVDGLPPPATAGVS